MIRWYITDRQRGKTTDLITWAKLGQKKQGWPYWTRIILEPTKAMADQLRGGEPETNKYGLEYHQVFYWEEWLSAYRGRMHLRRDLEIGIDNVDVLLGHLLRGWGQIARVTATGDSSRWPELIAMDQESNDQH